MHRYTQTLLLFKETWKYFQSYKFIDWEVNKKD